VQDSRGKYCPYCNSRFFEMGMVLGCQEQIFLRYCLRCGFYFDYDDLNIGSGGRERQE
jgi:hypothetical protein